MYIKKAGASKLYLEWNDCKIRLRCKNPDAGSLLPAAQGTYKWREGNIQVTLLVRESRQLEVVRPEVTTELSPFGTPQCRNVKKATSAWSHV